MKMGQKRFYWKGGRAVGFFAILSGYIWDKEMFNPSMALRAGSSGTLSLRDHRIFQLIVFIDLMIH